MEGKDLRQPAPGVHVDVPRLREGGVGLQVFAAYVPFDTAGEKAFAFANERLDVIEAFAQSDERLAPVETAAEARSIMAAGKTGVMTAVENGLAIEAPGTPTEACRGRGSPLEKLETFRRRKVRIMTLVHYRHLPWVASSTDSGPFRSDYAQPPGTSDRGGQSRGGLSRFGEQVVDAMNDLGLIPDLSHAAENAFWDVIRRLKKPVIASHSCAYSLCASARNLKDDQLKALGDSGGLVGVNFFSAFLSELFRQSYERNNNAVTPAVASVHVPMSLIADHIDYMVNMAGEDCVALGSDFDGIPAAPQGVTGSDFYPVLEAELRARGYTEKRIEKIFNLNFLRVLEEWD